MRPHRLAATMAATAALLALSSAPAAAEDPRRPEIVGDPTYLRISNIAPGQHRSATMKLTNVSDVDARVSAVVSASGQIVDAGHALMIEAQACSSPWEGESCPGGEPALLLGKAVTGTTTEATDFDLAAGESAHVLIGVGLGKDVGNEGQDLTGALSLTWVGVDEAWDGTVPEPTPTPTDPTATDEPSPPELDETGGPQQLDRSADDGAAAATTDQAPPPSSPVGEVVESLSRTGAAGILGALVLAAATIGTGVAVRASRTRTEDGLPRRGTA